MNNNDVIMNVPLDHTDLNKVVVQLTKKCTPFLSYDDAQLGSKFYDFNLLYAMWNKDSDEDYSEEVYAAVMDMFASNVFRPLPPSSYAAAADEETPASGGALIAAEQTAAGQAVAMQATAEFTQTAMVYQVFQAFTERGRFNADRAEPYMGRRFVYGLVHRLNSGDLAERQTVGDTMTRVWDTCPFSRGFALEATVAELADFAYGYVPRHNGIDQLFEFLTDTVVYGNVDPDIVKKLCKVLIHLLKHQYLFSFKAKLVDCVRTLDNDQKDLIPEMLIFISKLFSNHNLKTIFLLSTLGELYDWCDKDKWIPLQVQIVGALSKLFSNDDFQLADESMSFWNRILHDNIKFWQTRQDDIRVVVNALKKVRRNHWNADCMKMAKNFLEIMVMKKIIKDSCDDNLEESFQDESEGRKPNKLNFDYISKHILLPLKNSLTLKSLTDIPMDTESADKPYTGY